MIAGIIFGFFMLAAALVPSPIRPRFNARPFFGSDIDHDPQGML